MLGISIHRSLRCTPAAIAAACFAVLISAAACTTAYAEESPDTEQLVRELDSDRYEVRRRAQQQLIVLGEPAIPVLRKAFDNDSAEVRSRAREIVRRIEHERLLRDFRKLGRVADDTAIDLEEGLVLTAQILDPTARRETITQALDALAERVRKRLPKPPKESDPREAVEALRHVLFVEEDFDGNRTDYDNPSNSSIAYVLSTKRGLPILLSQVVIAVARRLELPIVGLALPGRFMVRYDDRRVPPPAHPLDLIIDPFESGKVMTMAELREYLPDLSGGGPEVQELFKPAGNRITLVRVLNNLSTAYLNREDFRRAAEVEEYREAVLGVSEATSD